MSMKEGFLAEISHVVQVRLEHDSRVAIGNLMLLQLEYGIDGTWKEQICTIRCTISGRFLQHRGDDFHKVKYIVELTLRCL